MQVHTMNASQIPQHTTVRLGITTLIVCISSGYNLD